MTNFIILSVILILDFLAARKIFHYPLMEKKSKRVHYFLIWLLPIVWACLILFFPFDPPKRDENFKTNHFSDSGFPMP